MKCTCNEQVKNNHTFVLSQNHSCLLQYDMKIVSICYSEVIHDGLLKYSTTQFFQRIQACMSMTCKFWYCKIGFIFIDSSNQLFYFTVYNNVIYIIIYHKIAFYCFFFIFVFSGLKSMAGRAIYDHIFSALNSSKPLSEISTFVLCVS